VVAAVSAGPGGGDAAAMRAAVAAARARLADGDTAVAVLVQLWQAGYATGTAAEKQRADRKRPDGGPERGDGWAWGAHYDLTAGTAFRYGGCDPVRPGADRAARVLPYPARKGGRLAMGLADTGEQALIPVLFWARPEPVPSGQGGEAGG
jgi:hypothetical protein